MLIRIIVGILRIILSLIWFWSYSPFSPIYETLGYPLITGFPKFPYPSWVYSTLALLIMGLTAIVPIIPALTFIFRLKNRFVFRFSFVFEVCFLVSSFVYLFGGLKYVFLDPSIFYSDTPLLGIILIWWVILSSVTIVVVATGLYFMRKQYIEESVSVAKQ